jgi:antitoxin ParD1/3/4
LTFLVIFLSFLVIIDAEEPVNVSLTPELERLVNLKIESGLYQTASEVVREALRLLQQRDESVRFLRSDVRAGIEQAEPGKSGQLDGRSARGSAAPVKARGRRRLTRPKKTGRRL